ncbi:peptide-N(4)-(N-acetyl-beta-glucosaminyl)asparagine amidase-like [Anneissia japonica]|uniref:peptide-N(4)-(N-acetyl-beta- glucosaminyl)asparagine amidase-like n=1 Tax=Anneissia japonica TaxID=1529436 RepID=UPI0014258EB5|nr:peptide-N(4)-(N-acetyl-beta-glucosaminyl)asparagine amidase-like [Anneissia japonica]
MATLVQDNIRQLLENETSVFLDVSNLLLRFANNLIRYPKVAKYANIPLGKKAFTERMLPSIGGVECLLVMGFEEDDEYLRFPETSSLSIVREVQRLLASARLKVLSEHALKGMSTPSPSDERAFLMKVHGTYDHVMVYEEVMLQQKALQVMPLSELKQKAQRKLQRSNQGSSNNQPLDLQDYLILELLRWFKSSFFQWMDAPPCRNCQASTQAAGGQVPTSEDLMWGAQTVEVYRCTVCTAITRFPRYNHPGKLLETRTGRCGEWANCFTLCCRAAGFEARYVLDWTDHVWTEVYSNSQKRWMHCDACENTCDKPLLYEHGWGKKLSYVIAFSCEEVVDVTWRYSSKHDEVLRRRTLCRQEVLMDKLAKLNLQRQRSISSFRKAVLEERFALELAEFIAPKKVQDGEGQGRISGSLAWRTSRGETGDAAQGVGTSIMEGTGYKFQLTEIEKGSKTIHVQYSPSSNTYQRVSSGNSVLEDWESGVFTMSNVILKEEFDWKMVYLARVEGSQEAFITWKFDAANTGLVVDHVDIKVSSKTYESGRIIWTICDDQKTLKLKGDGEIARISELEGATEVTLKADMSGGKGDVAWQHTQLFRMGLNDMVNYPFDVKIILKNA